MNFKLKGILGIVVLACSATKDSLINEFLDENDLY